MKKGLEPIMNKKGVIVGHLLPSVKEINFNVPTLDNPHRLSGEGYKNIFSADLPISNTDLEMLKKYNPKI